MADFVLRHRVGPSTDFRDVRGGLDTEQFAKLVAHGGYDLIIGKLHDRALHHAARECAREDCACGCASFELEAREAAGDYAPMLTCRRDKAKRLWRTREVAL